MSLFPATRVVLPEGRRATFYLAAEEYLARAFRGTYFFTWVLGPTVVVGRNQDVLSEVDVDYCLASGIDLVRRKSGGGAIYADEGNVMTSLVCRGGSVEPIFAEYAHAVADALTRLGAPTEVSGRNDILLRGGGKVCGLAFYHLADRNIVHGTMLYDTQARQMAAALRPAPQKLAAKGVKSVRQRVGLLKEVVAFPLAELRPRLERLLTEGEQTLTADDLAAIEAIERTYATSEELGVRSVDFVANAATPSTLLTPRATLPGVGTLAIALTLRGGLIYKVGLTGDFFETEPAAPLFERALAGVAPTREAIRAALTKSHPERAIRGLTLEALLTLF